MSFSLPYSRARRYLTGIDWVVGALDQASKNSGGAGAISQVIVQLAGRVEERALRAALLEVGRALPLLFGRVARDWGNLAPYWKVQGGAPAAGRELQLRVTEARDLAQAEGMLAEHANWPLAGAREHVRFLLVGVGAESRLGMVFDHRLLDAFGAEAFLRLIDLAWQGKKKMAEVAQLVQVTEPAHLDEWPRRLRSGKVLTEMYAGLRAARVAALKMPGQGGPRRRVRFLHEALTVQETAEFVARSDSEIRVPILLPSALARGMAALKVALPVLPLAGDRLLAFTTVTTRTPGKEWEQLFFNPYSFLIFDVANQPQDVGALALGLGDQLFELMKKGVPQAVADAALLGRICPQWLVSQMVASVGRGRMCSLYFSCQKESGFGEGDFLGVRVGNLVHTPLAFCPPGVNACMTWFGGRFNLVLSYVEGAMAEGVARRMMGEFKRSLVAP